MVDIKTERKPCACGNPDCHDIPEITDWSKAVRKSSFAEARKNGYTIIVERKDHNEIIEIKKRWEDKEGNPLSEPPKRDTEVIIND